MRRLFLKIFVWFWIVQFVIGAVLFVLTTAMRFQFDENSRPETEYAMNLIARSAAADYENGGEATLRENLRAVEKKAHVRAYLFDENGRALLDDPMPPPLRDLAQNTARAPSNKIPNRRLNDFSPPRDLGNRRAPNQNAPHLDEPRGFLGDAPPRGGFGPDAGRPDAGRGNNRRDDNFAVFSARAVLSPRGRRFVLASEFRRPPRGFTPGFIADLVRPNGPNALRLLVLVLTSGVLCYGLARYLTSPAVTLSSATRQLASGDLTARVGAKMGRRRDELADLGRDFDAMAEQIETLMLSQRRLLGDISHELRSPLTRMTVALDLIEDMLDKNPSNAESSNAEFAEKTENSESKNAQSSTRSTASALQSMVSAEIPASANDKLENAELANVELAKEDLELRREMRSYLTRMRRESERLNALIGQLLTLARLESGSARVEETPLDLARMLSEIAQDADFEARSRDCRVQISHSAALWTRGAPELVHSAIENVVRNAVNYTAKQSVVALSLQAESDRAGRDWALIRVLDWGDGVPESALQNLFRPFYRVADARDRQSGGTGLGLAITERALRLHGGKVEAHNAPGSGLVVELRFPLTPNPLTPNSRG